jgi:branched-subunit amino acid aminotransferase/4-amino-4-deoxychorismate lyase
MVMLCLKQCTQVQFFKDHITRLKHGLKKLKMSIPKSIESGKILLEIEYLLNKNKFLKGARIRLCVFRNNGGNYTPTTNNTSYIVSAYKLPFYDYRLNDKGVSLGLFTELRKQQNYLANIKSSNALIYIMAGIYAQENNLDDCIILNENNNIIETTSSNIFVIKNNIALTPPLSDGCVAGIMRKQIIKLLLAMKVEVNKETQVKPQHLLMADEVFITNSINGIRWIKGFENKRYYNTISKQLITELNYLAFRY